MKHDKLIQKSRLFRQVFDNADGKKVLAELEAQYSNVELADLNNPNTTYYKLGGRDVVRYIIQMMAAEENLTKIEGEQQ